MIFISEASDAQTRGLNLYCSSCLQRALAVAQTPYDTEKLENYTYTPGNCFSETTLEIQDARLALKTNLHNAYTM